MGMDEVVLSVGETTAAFYTAAAISGTTGEETDDLVPVPSADPRLEQLLLAQRRTNELLELALGVAFDAGLE